MVTEACTQELTVFFRVVNILCELAISGVLNNPTKRPSSTAKPTKADIPPVAPVSVRKVKASEFDSYIKHITPVIERYQGNRAGVKSADGANAHSPRSPFNESLANRIESVRNPYSVPELPESKESVPMKPSMPDTPALSTVPSIFFDPDFNFENPRTFDLVCEQTGPSDAKSNATSIVTNSILQEKLSHYLDTVEIHLMTEISRRSTSFFEALSNLQALHSQTLECVSQIHVLRAQLARIDHTQSKQGLEVVRLKRRRRNLGLLHNGIRMVKEIRSTQPMIQVLLGNTDYFGALDLIDGAQQVLIDGDMKRLESCPGFDPSLNLVPSSTAIATPRSLDIRGVSALVHFGGQLTEMRKMIGKMMESDFVELLLNDFRSRVGKLDVGTLLVDLSKTDLQDKLLPLIYGLLRTNRAAFALQAYREQILQETKNIIKSQYPPPDPDTLDSNVSVSAKKKDQMAALTKQLREMSALTFYKMLSYIYAFLLGALQRVSLYHQVILHYGGTLTSPRTSYGGSVQSPPLLRQLETESEEILFAVADLAHTRCAKLMGMRSEQSSKLLPAEIYRLLGLTWSFILQSELLSGYMCYGLRTAILSQSKAFLLQFHVKKTGQLAVAVGEDQWAPVSVPRSSQATVDEIIAISTLSLHEARNKDFTMAFNILRLSTPPPPPADGMDDQDSYIPSRLKSKGPSETAAKNDNTPAAEVPDSPVLVVQEEMFRVVSSSLVLLDVLAEYLDILNNISALTTEVMQRIIEVLKLFNSRTCQVILGAGAMRSAGLKNITAKHLALASQSLSVIATLMPFIKDWIRAKMSDKQMVMLTEFDRILRDFQEHQNEIYAKLVAIMQERLSVHIRNMTNPTVVDYDALNRPAQQLADGGNVNTFMDLMVKEVTTLHKILCKFLPAASMRVRPLTAMDDRVEYRCLLSSLHGCCNGWNVLLTRCNHSS
ncbi:MAG: Vps54-like protein-domain-containing protein [Benniella sp.]|nr:MAG: Vps54-like protein-domain-containing protein [Benniella sp.]